MLVRTNRYSATDNYQERPVSPDKVATGDVKEKYIVTFANMLNKEFPSSK